MATQVSINTFLDRLFEAYGREPGNKLHNTLDKLFEAIEQKLTQGVGAMDATIDISKLLGVGIKDARKLNDDYIKIAKGVLRNLATQLGNNQINFNAKEMDLNRLFGTPPKISQATNVRYQELLRGVLTRLRQNLPADFKFDRGISFSDLFTGRNADPIQGWTGMRYRSLLRTVFSRLSRTLIDVDFTSLKEVRLKDLFDPQGRQLGFFSGLAYRTLMGRVFNRLRASLANAEFTFEKGVTLSELFGQTPEWGRMLKISYFYTVMKVLGKVRSQAETIQFEKVDLKSILGEVPADNLIVRFGYQKAKMKIIDVLKNRIISIIKRYNDNDLLARYLPMRMPVNVPGGGFNPIVEPSRKPVKVIITNIDRNVIRKLERIARNAGGGSGGSGAQGNNNPAAAVGGLFSGIWGFIKTISTFTTSLLTARLLPAVLKHAKTLTNTILKGGTKAFKSLATKVWTALGGIATRATTLIRQASSVGGKTLLIGLGKVAGSAIGFIIDGISGAFKMKEWGTSRVSSVIGAVIGGSEKGIMNSFLNAGKWAILGATIGSVVPVVGTIAGGVIGAIIGAVTGWIGGEKIARWLDDVGTKFNDKIKTAFAGITVWADKISGMFDGVGNTAKRWWEKLRGKSNKESPHDTQSPTGIPGLQGTPPLHDFIWRNGSPEPMAFDSNDTVISTKTGGALDKKLDKLNENIRELIEVVEKKVGKRIGDLAEATAKSQPVVVGGGNSGSTVSINNNNSGEIRDPAYQFRSKAWTRIRGTVTVV